MNEKSLAHTRWECVYHIVWIPKYRRKILYGECRAEVDGVIYLEMGELEGVGDLEIFPPHVERSARRVDSPSANRMIGSSFHRCFVILFCKHPVKLICRPLCDKISFGQIFLKNIAFDIEDRGIMTFGEMVKYARKQLGMTQIELANALGVSFATVNRWENEQVNPSSLAQKAFEDFCESSFISFPRE